MEVAAKFHNHQPLCLSLYHHRPSFSRPIASLSRTPPSPLPSPPPSSLKSSLLIKSFCSSPSSSSSFSDPPFPSPKTPKPKFTENLNRFPFSLLKASAIASIAAAAIVLAGHFNLKPPVAAAISPLPTIEKQALSDVEALTNLMEVKTKNRKDVKEAIGIVEWLIELEPNDIDLQLQKSNLHCDSGELEMAKLGFNEVIKKDPFKVPAYHGLTRVALQEDPSGGGLGEIEKKVRKAMELCQRKKRKDDLRNFKLLMAPIRVIEGKYNEALKICEELVEEEPTKNILPYTYLSQFMFSIGSRNFKLLIAPILFFEGKHNEALKVYQELVNEEPRDFWPYLCQGIIYTSLRKTDEATKLLHKYLEARS